ncbi:MAG: 16S rRNA (guanine(527)-N(7))-methyltransferase RsmG [Synergistaceae bacterium]|jgi:16S rRNA (guanine527-N7)-methyltransferase|nr:16S rRNA (guanine(527)-N(7))-methyltransferase RsmG [Synergistaceae bacterium]
MEITEDMKAQLRRFARLIAAANDIARVTGPSDENVIYEEHVKDALAAIPYLEKFPAGGSFADVGTGGGLPGIVWGICRPDMRGLLVDSIGKKTDIVLWITDELKLKNITVLNERSEETASSHRETFDIATARAVADAPVLAEYLSPLVRTGGMLIAFKGPRAAAEIGGIHPHDWRQLGLGPPSLVPYEIPGRERSMVIWTKISACPARFPRKPGEAKKNPWNKYPLGKS